MKNILTERQPNKTIVFGGGCFWCTEAVFSSLNGIVSVTPGYAGGSVPDPTYEKVSTGRTWHAEVVRVEYNPQEITLDDLLSVFFATHDPTTLNRQGNDVGTDYRSLILFADSEQEAEIKNFIVNLEKEKVFDDKIVTEVKPLDKFYQAEKHHIEYYKNNSNQPYCQLIINPKLEKLQKKFSKLLKN